VSSLPRLFLALVIWLVGYLALFMGIMARDWRRTVKKKKNSRLMSCSSLTRPKLDSSLARAPNEPS
jgi:hypothetical protein